MEVNFCGKCGSRLYQGSKFCPSCGNQVVEPFVCPECKKELHPDTELCPSCGLVIEHEETPIDTEIDKQKTLIEIEESKEASPKLDSVDNLEKTQIEPVEQTPILSEAPAVNNKKKIKMAKIKGSIQVSRMIILILGIFTLIQAFLLMIVLGYVLSVSSSSSTSGSLFNQSYNQQNSGHDVQSINKQASIRQTANLSKKNVRKLIKIFILLFILSLIQGIGFLYLSKLIRKKPFIAILIAFIFKITFDIVRVVAQIIQSINGIIVGYGSVSDKLPKTLIIVATFFQVALIGVISGVLCYYLYKGLKNSIELRKIES